MTPNVYDQRHQTASDKTVRDSNSDRRTSADPGNEERRPGLKDIWQPALATLTFFTFMTVGWLGAQAIFNWLGHPPVLLEYLISVAISIFIGIICVSIVGRIKGSFSDQNPESLSQELLYALDSISHGDFSVRIRSTHRGPFADVVESVNNMAAELDTLEQRRQQFISNVSHEIQSPLTSISGFAELLRDANLDDASRAHFLDVIAAETRRLSKLSDNLLRLSFLEDATDLDQSRIQIDDQLRSVVLMLEPQWAAKELDVELELASVQLAGNEEMLRQVWINLVQNAIKYTSEAGNIRVKLCVDGDRLRCEVIDTGIGIAPGDLRQVFERFYRVDKARSGEGNGLGLALAKRIVELHGGTLSVASEPGVGSTFTVALPMS